MSKRNAAALRAARMERLQKEAAAPGPQSQKQSQPKTAAPEPTTPKVDGTLTAEVLNPVEIDKSASFNMILFGKDSSDPHWMLTANGRPVAEIRLSDQDDVEKTARIFTTDQYATSVIESAKQLELSEILAGIKARPYFATLAKSEAFKHLQTSVTASVKEEYARKAAEMRGDLINVLKLVVEAETKNYITENPLKDSLLRRMAAAGIEMDRAVSIIEGSWQEAAPGYFEACFKQAAEWQDMHPEAYADLQERVAGMQPRTPKIEVEDDSPSPRAPRVPREAANVPFTTATGTAKVAEVDVKQDLKSRLSLRARRLGHDMPPK